MKKNRRIIICNCGLANKAGDHIDERGSIPEIITPGKAEKYAFYFELPTDFSRELLADAMNKRLGSHLTKEDFKENGGGRIEKYGDLGDVEVRDVLFPLDKFLEAYINRDRSKESAAASR